MVTRDREGVQLLCTFMWGPGVRTPRTPVLGQGPREAEQQKLPLCEARGPLLVTRDREGVQLLCTFMTDLGRIDRDE